MIDHHIDSRVEKKIGGQGDCAWTSCMERACAKVSHAADGYKRSRGCFLIPKVARGDASGADHNLTTRIRFV